MERKICDASALKILGADDPGGSQYGLIKGYPAVFGNWDRADELIEPGALAAHTDTFLRDGFISADHVWGFAKSIATPVSVIEDGRGWYGVAEFHSTAEAQTVRTVAHERLARGKSVALSFGYDVLAAEADTKGGRTGRGGKRLRDLYPYEWSIVTVPCNPEAQAVGVKGSLPDGLRLDTHAETVLATVQEFVARAQGLSELRTKAGRTISRVNSTKLQAVHLSMQDCMTILEELLEAAGMTDPNEGAEPSEKAHALRDEYVRYLATQARTLGVIV